MNRGHIQSERAASAQRDLFASTIKACDKAISTVAALAQEHDPETGFFKTVDPYKVMEALRPAIAALAYESTTGPTVRSLTDALNNKL